MTARLADLSACFEGVIPSIIATAGADGTPNISYLSQVVVVDERHVGLSNQFFSKTASNIRVNPQAALLLVDARNGEQFRLDMVFVKALGDGEVFEQVRSQLQAISMQVGMAGVFNLRGVDVYEVGAVHQVPCPVATASPAVGQPAGLRQAADIVKAISEQSDVDGIVDTVLDRIRACFGYESTMLLLNDASRSVLTTLGSRGYDKSGVGSEVALGEGIIGAAAADRRLMKVSDMSRVRRLGEAIRSSASDENRTRTIALPGIADPMSQIAESLAGETPAPVASGAGQAAIDRPFRITHHAYDDSVFIDNEYVIKGVSGRLLMLMLEAYSREGRREFTNRELRLNGTIRLPDIKDNLESRLLLLRRRLEDKALPLRLTKTGRGRFSLELSGRPVLDHVG